MNKLQFIRGKIIEANKSILDLKFGCEIITSHWGDETKETISFLSVGGDELEFGCSARIECIKKSEILKTIGRPITLPDVLLAMEMNRNSRYIASDVGQLLGFEAGDGEMYWEPNLGGGFGWNLKKTFDEQENVVIGRIYGILK